MNINKVSRIKYGGEQPHPGSYAYVMKKTLSSSQHHVPNSVYEDQLLNCVCGYIYAIYPLLQCQSSSSSVGKSIWPASDQHSDDPGINLGWIPMSFFAIRLSMSFIHSTFTGVLFKVCWNSLPHTLLSLSPSTLMRNATSLPLPLCWSQLRSNVLRAPSTRSERELR